MENSSIHESWGVLLAALARRDTTAQLVVTGRDQCVALQLECGRVVDAKSQAVADAALRIALINNIVLPSQVAAIEQQLAAEPTRDEIAVIQEVVSLPETLVDQLHARVLTHRIARTFAFEHTNVELRDARPAVVCRRGVEVRQPIYAGARAHLTPEQLRGEVRALGSFFALHSDAPLDSYGFRDEERSVLDVLARGAPLAEIERWHGDAHMAHAVVYALACCRDLDTLTGEVPSITFARGTIDDVRPAMLDARLAADQAARRAELALASSPETALREITRAIELDPATVDYRALHAWARLCCAKDKHAIAAETRRVLAKVVHLSNHPEIAEFYLGRLERILGHDRDALIHFQNVLMARPKHPQACAEVRAILSRLDVVERGNRGPRSDAR